MLEKNIKLLARLLHNPDLLLRQPIQLVDQRVDLPVRGLDAPPQRRLLVGRAGLWELFMQGEHLLHQKGHAVVAGDVGGVGEIGGAEWDLLEILDQEMDINPTDYDFHHKGTKLTKNAQRRINKKIS